MANGQNRPARYDYQPESVSGKAVVITGGTTGIGRTTALLLASQGAKVLIFGRHEPELNDALNEIKAAGGEVYGLTADQANIEDVKRVFQTADEKLGGVDILINNAAEGGGSITEKGYEEYEYLVRANLTGYMACADEAAKRMKQKGDGHILDVGSLSAKSRGEGSDIYVATKSGIRGFTDSLAKTLNKDGIRVTLVEPGLVGTDMTADNMSPQEQEKKEEQEMKMLKTEDLAECILYCLTQPKRCDVALVQIRPTKQSV
ncbi:MAG: SDR family oxidoreductase [Armatimonadetes bacterium]|nr:SDR family oxidoreductase [Armatimonadota bacterium]